MRNSGKADILHMVKANKISVHPSRMPVTPKDAMNAIHTAQGKFGFKVGVNGGWSQPAWEHLFEHFASQKRRASVDVTEIIKKIDESD